MARRGKGRRKAGGAMKNIRLAGKYMNAIGVGSQMRRARKIISGRVFKRLGKL